MAGGAARNAGRRDTLLDGPWLSDAVLTRLPRVWRDFEHSRDPLIRAQRLDLERSEAERRGDQSGRGSAMVERDKPVPAPRPRDHTRAPVDRAAFAGRWLTEQREAAWANAAPGRNRSNEPPALARHPKEPSR